MNNKQNQIYQVRNLIHPTFELKQTKAWLMHLEAAFYQNAISDNETKYHFTVSRIPLPILEEIVEQSDMKHYETQFDYNQLKCAIVKYAEKKKAR